MPIYEYQCTDCGFEKDVLQKMSDPVLSECPTCHEQSFIKLISAPSFRLKGEGWYETDFKTGDKKNLASSDADSPSSPASGSSDGGSASASSTSSNSSSSSASNSDSSSSSSKPSASKSSDS